MCVYCTLFIDEYVHICPMMQSNNAHMCVYTHRILCKSGSAIPLLPVATQDPDPYWQYPHFLTASVSAQEHLVLLVQPSTAGAGVSRVYSCEKRASHGFGPFFARSSRLFPSVQLSDHKSSHAKRNM